MLLLLIHLVIITNNHQYTIISHNIISTKTNAKEERSWLPQGLSSLGYDGSHIFGIELKYHQKEEQCCYELTGGLHMWGPNEGSPGGGNDGRELGMPAGGRLGTTLGQFLLGIDISDDFTWPEDFLDEREAFRIQQYDGHDPWWLLHDGHHSHYAGHSHVQNDDHLDHIHQYDGHDTRHQYDGRDGYRGRTWPSAWW